MLLCLATWNNQAGASRDWDLSFGGSSELGLTSNRSPHHSWMGLFAKLLQLKNIFFISPARLDSSYNSAQSTSSNELVLPLFL